MSDYVANLLVVILLYSMLSVTLTMLLGQAGLFSVAHAVFFGIGAYATATLTTRFGIAWLSSAGAGIIAAGLIAVAIAAISLRVSEDYFVIGSFGLQVIASSAFLNLQSVTGGVDGIAGVPLPQILGWSPDGPSGFVWLAGGIAVLGATVVGALERSPYGRALRATREDPIAAAALGKSPAEYKVSAFLVAGSLAALAGSVYASYRSFVSPDDFTIDLSILLVAMVVIGGLGRISGAITGTVLLLLLPEALRQVQVPPTVVGPLQQLLYGLLLVVFALLRPQGLLGGGPPLRLRPGSRRPRN